MTTPLWTPDPATLDGSPLRQFQSHIARYYGVSADDYAALHTWSVKQPEVFWQAVWQFTGIIASQQPEQVVEHGRRFSDTKWFPGARLNYAENMLRRCDDKPAVVSILEDGKRHTQTYAELYQEVARVAEGLKTLGVGPGDRVAGVMPNIAPALVAMLAATSIGAIWTSCSPDFGVEGVLDRLGQTGPKVLIGCDGYVYNGKRIDVSAKLAQIADRLPGLSGLIRVPVLGDAQEHAGSVPVISWAALAAPKLRVLDFVQLPFEHPLFILYSSGTTGAPKCITHSAGGTLTQHLKEHLLHTGLSADDTLFFFTTCSWMMWNWMASSLAQGGTLVLYDGSPFSPDPTRLIDMIDAEGITVFGTSPRYLAELAKAGHVPVQTHDLSTLRMILSTGAPLTEDGFDYVYQAIKADVCLSSISGGTDIISCFALGNPDLPVHRGQLQCLGLGMAVEFWNESGQPVVGQKGELVCTKPFPSAPLGFWGDEDGQRYQQAYFVAHDGVWAQGDFGEIMPEGSVVIHGRSDAVLNPGGVRIGTAEIYRQVARVPEVIESVVIGQKWQGDERVVLFVTLMEGQCMTKELHQRIRQTIRTNTTPRHVPAQIVAVADIPRTHTGKIVEIAVRDTVNGTAPRNTSALANPEALELFANLPQLSS